MHTGRASRNTRKGGVFWIRRVEPADARPGILEAVDPATGLPLEPHRRQAGCQWIARPGAARAARAAHRHPALAADTGRHVDGAQRVEASHAKHRALPKRHSALGADRRQQQVEQFVEEVVQGAFRGTAGRASG